MLLFYTVVLGLLHVQHVLCQDDSMDVLQASEMGVMPSELPYVMTELPYVMTELPYVMTELPGIMTTSQDVNVIVETAVMQPSSSPADILPSSTVEVVQATSSVTETLTTESLIDTIPTIEPQTANIVTTEAENLLTTEAEIGPTTGSMNIVTTIVCLDRTDDCPLLAHSVCSDFRDWSRYYCPKFCDECDNIAMTPPTGGIPPQATQPSTETPTETTTEAVTEPPTTELITEPPTTEPITEPLTTEQPTTEQPTTEQPTTEQPTTEQPTTEPLTTEQPTTEPLTTEQPTTEPITEPITEPPTTEAVTEACCTDQIGWQKCLDYHEESCQEPYRAWASQRCQAFCGMCKPCPIEPCVDMLPNCQEYGTDSCNKVNFRKWAMQNCRKHCGLCTNYGFYYQLNNLTAPTQSGATSGPGGPTSGPGGPTSSVAVVGSTAGSVSVCQDKVINCTEYGQGDCAKYSKFMSAYCPRYCSFCSDTVNIAVSQEPVTPGGGSSTGSGVTEKPDVSGGCGDTLSNCTSLAKENCCGIYQPWARAHCASYCGFCGVPPDRVCDDQISYCDRMNPDLCTNEVFRQFREANCAGFCKLCDTPWEPPKCTAHLFHPVPTQNVPTNMVG